MSGPSDAEIARNVERWNEEAAESNDRAWIESILIGVLLGVPALLALVLS